MSSKTLRKAECMYNEMDSRENEAYNSVFAFEIKIKNILKEVCSTSISIYILTFIKY